MQEKKGWLQEHLRDFVQPRLDAATGPNKVELRAPKRRFFTSDEMTIIKAAWRSFKSWANGRPILLPGRDTFIFYVLAMREGREDVTFWPEVSRDTVYQIRKEIMNGERFLPGDTVLLDTGWAGTIPGGLGIKSFKFISYDTHKGINQYEKQIFPNLRFARELAIKIESTPKYWRAGVCTYLDDYPSPVKIVQDFSPFSQFLAAAALTLEVWTDSSPRVGRKSLVYRPVSSSMWGE